MPSTLDELGISRTAVHEAGHAVAAIYHRRYVEEISVIKNDTWKSFGHVKYQGTDDKFINSIIYASGELAVAMLGENPDFDTSGSKDFADIKRFYLADGGNPEMFRAYIGLVVDSAKEIFSTPLAMALTLAIADRVDRERELNTSAINEEIRRVKGILNSTSTE